MLSKKNPDIRGSKTITIIAEGVTVDGKINSPGSTRIDGTVTGEIIADKEIVRGKSRCNRKDKGCHSGRII